MTNSSSLLELVELFLLCNQFKQPITNQVVVKIESLLKDGLALLTQLKEEPLQRAIISLNMFHKKIIQILTDREIITSVLERFNFKEKTLENQLNEVSVQLKDAQASRQILYQIQNSVNIALDLLGSLKGETKLQIGNLLKDINFKVDKPRQNLFKFEEGRFENGLKIGFFKELSLDGDSFEGVYVNGARHGHGCLKTAQFQFEGDFEFGIPIFGKGQLIHNDQYGQSFSKLYLDVFNYLGEFKNKEFQGTGTIFFKNMGYFQGQFTNGQIDQNQ